MAAYSFPTNPANGEKYPPDNFSTGRTQYQWDAVAGVWTIVPRFIQTGSLEAYNEYVWPSSNGGPNQQLETDGEGNLIWSESGKTYLQQLKLDDVFNGTRLQFSIQDMEGNPFAPEPAANIMVFLGGVPQIPDQSFIVEDDAITFSEPPPTGANFYAVTSSIAVG